MGGLTSTATTPGRLDRTIDQDCFQIEDLAKAAHSHVNWRSHMLHDRIDQCWKLN